MSTHEEHRRYLTTMRDGIASMMVAMQETVEHMTKGLDEDLFDDEEWGEKFDELLSIMGWTADDQLEKVEPKPD